jgi:alanyl-tRNA synthetase
VEVVDEEDRIAHVLDSPLTAATEVEGIVDWPRRFDHMQQHTGQHLLSAVFEELYSFPTLSFHLGVDSSTIDLGTPSLTPEQAARAEQRCAEVVAEARPVSVSYEDATSASGLRKESARTGTLRIVSIDHLDRSACGGTHVSSTAAIGPVLLRKLEKMRGNMRVEFVCGLRALRAARQDYRLLNEIGRSLSASYDRAPEWIASSVERLKALEKFNQRLASELAVREARELHAATAPGPDGLRRLTQRGPIDDAMRARAQAFTAGGQAVFLAISNDPPALLLAASADTSLHAGNLLKPILSSAGGRGGGNQTLAQGSLPNAESLSQAIQLLTSQGLLH